MHYLPEAKTAFAQLHVQAAWQAEAEVLSKHRWTRGRQLSHDTDSNHSYSRPQK